MSLEVENMNMVEMSVDDNSEAFMVGDDTARIIQAVSPTATTERVTGGAKLTVIDKNGTTEVTIYDGEKGETGDTGQQGPPGEDGANGQDGADGYSPTVSVTTIEGGHTVTVTDASGTETFNVMDGQDGAPGQDGQDGQDGAPGFGIPTGGVAGDVIVKKSSTDYDLEWKDNLLHPAVSFSMTIPANGWTLTSGEYVYTLTDARVTSYSLVTVEPYEGADNVDEIILDYEQISGGVKFYLAEQPAAGIPVTVNIYYANGSAVQQIDDTDVSSDAITGAANVHEALSSLNSKITFINERGTTAGTNVTMLGEWSTYNTDGQKNFRVQFHITAAISNGDTILTLPSTLSPVGGYASGVAVETNGGTMLPVFITGTTVKACASITSGFYVLECSYD